MDKESTIMLQKIDCNCSDCKYMIRDSERMNKSLEFHKSVQLNEFNRDKQNVINKAEEQRIKKGNLDAWQTLNNEANKMRFQFDKKEIRINYGDCDKLKKPVSFIPNTCQIETQDCFEHRRA